MPFTSSQVEAIKPAAKVKDYTIEKLGMSRGCLLLRVHPNGDKIFYYRYFQNGTKRFALLGQFDSKGQKCWRGLRGERISLAAAKEGTKALADIVSAHGDLEIYEAEQIRIAKEAASCGSFGQLLDTYVEHLQTSGRVRLKNVEGALNLHVRQGFPNLILRKANEIKSGDIQAILAKLVSAGKTRQVNLVRTYLHAAFNLAARHDNDPRRVANNSVRFNLASNPVTLIPVISEYNRPGERVLSKHELTLFWQALTAAPIIPALFIKLNLTLGGQRIEQLLRAEWPDYDFENRILTLKDEKGRPGLGKRDHLVPLTDQAITLLETLKTVNANGHPFAVSRAVRMDVGTPTKLVTKISKQLQQEHDITHFRAGDLRRSCETHLAALGISKEVRAQLLSHGRSTGVQARHYDRYAYLPEKFEALKKWENFLNELITTQYKNNLHI